MQCNVQEEKKTVPGYGTEDAPLSIEEARVKVREDFLELAGLVMSRVSLPPGHGYRNSSAFGLQSQLRWAGCEVLASQHGLSIFAGRSLSDCGDANQLSVEVRYFHPELHYREARGKSHVSRRYDSGYSAHLWVEQGRPFWGQHVSLIRGHEFCRDFGSTKSLGDSIVERLNNAIGARQLSTAEDRLIDLQKTSVS